MGCKSSIKLILASCFSILFVISSSSAEVRVTGTKPKPRTTTTVKQASTVNLYIKDPNSKDGYIDLGSPYFQNVYNAIANTAGKSEQLYLKVLPQKQAKFNSQLRTFSRKFTQTGNAVRITPTRKTNLFKVNIAPKFDSKAKSLKLNGDTFSGKNADLNNLLTSISNSKDNPVVTLLLLLLVAFVNQPQDGDTLTNTPGTGTGTGTGSTEVDNYISSLLDIPDFGTWFAADNTVPNQSNAQNASKRGPETCSDDLYWYGDNQCCFGQCTLPHGGGKTCKKKDGSCPLPGAGGQGFLSCSALGGSREGASGNCAERETTSMCPAAQPCAYSCEDINGAGGRCDTSIRGTRCSADCNPADGFNGSQVEPTSQRPTTPKEPDTEQRPENNVTCYGAGGRVCTQYDMFTCGVIPGRDSNGFKTGECCKPNGATLVVHWRSRNTADDCCSNRSRMVGAIVSINGHACVDDGCMVEVECTGDTGKYD